jgi:hypothetical protein
MSQEASVGDMLRGRHVSELLLCLNFRFQISDGSHHVDWSFLHCDPGCCVTVRATFIDSIECYGDVVL